MNIVVKDAKEKDNMKVDKKFLNKCKKAINPNIIIKKLSPEKGNIFSIKMPHTRNLQLIQLLDHLNH